MATPQTDTHVREQTRRDEQGHKNGDAARAGVEKLADFRQRATGEDGERLARQSGQNVEAITKFGTVLTQAYQDTPREWYGLAQKQLQRNLEGLSKLAHCRSVQDFAATQSGLVRESLRYMVEDAGSIVEISLRAVDEARRAVAGTAQEKGRSGALAA